MKTIYLVVPCFNEEDVLPQTFKLLCSQLDGLVKSGRISEESRALFVDDGSKDKTWELIEASSKNEPYVCGLRLSRNCGHQNALLAGLMTAKDFSDAVISLDADLQDDVGALPLFVDKYSEGCDIVYGIRNSRQTDTAFKRGTAHCFYRIMKLMGVELVSDHADYRLMSRRAIESLSQFREVNLFLRGMIPLIGFKTGNVYYERHERFAGKSKYPFRKMVSFAVEGITSFSIVPLRCINFIGAAVFLAGLVILISSLVLALTGNPGAGLDAAAGSVFFVGGIILLCLGICAEYIGKTYKEVKSRPHYFIDKAIIK